MHKKIVLFCQFVNMAKYPWNLELVKKRKIHSEVQKTNLIPNVFFLINIKYFPFILKCLFFSCLWHAKPYWWEKFKQFIIKKDWHATSWYQKTLKLIASLYLKFGVAEQTILIVTKPLVLVENSNELFFFFSCFFFFFFPCFKAPFCFICLAFYIKQAVHFHLFIPLQKTND